MKVIAMVLAACAATTALAQTKWTYPAARMDSVVDTYHGTEVADPYRWLEDPDATETRAWIEAQNKLTRNYLAGVPQRDAIEERIRTLWNYEKFGTPFKEGGKYFWSYNTGLQNQNVIYVADSLTGEGRVLIDPNTLREDGTAALSGLAINDGATVMAYGVADAGSDWNTWKVRDIATGKDTEDVLNWVKFSGASFTKDGKGFFYSRFDEPGEGENKLTGSNYYQKLFYHAVGTPQSADVLVYHEPAEEKKDWGFGGTVTDDGEYLVIHVSKGTDPKNRVYVKRIGASPSAGALADGEVVKLLDAFDASYDYVGNDGPTFYFKTDLNAPRGRLIAINLNHPEPGAWKELIAQNDATLISVSMVGDQFFANYLRDAKSQVAVHDRAGKHLRNVDLPGIGTAGGFSGRRTDTETFYSFTGFTSPPRIYHYDLATGKSTLFKEAKVNFNPDDYEAKQEFYKSKDGTRVPMFIVHKKGLKRDGSNPTLLYGYGGFNIPITPSFSVTNLVWMEMGGVFVVANIRGGGEYGEEWHQAGTKLKKQNVFDDFIAAAEWLIANKYTSNKKLAIRGGSNGGLLVGACMTQRPDLFGAALPEVGVLDMLRFHKFTIGHAWTSDYGAADGDKDTSPEQFKTLLAYSPLHNVKRGACYPATMIMTADHDDRVVPAHSFKFAAALQAAQSCDNPTLIRVETRAGHGAGKPTAKIIEEAADRWAFLVRALDMNPTIPGATKAEAEPADENGWRRVSLHVTGMRCEMCVAAVEKSLKSVKGVRNVRVDLATKTATLEADNAIDADVLASAFKGTEFSATVQ
ncbi:MAG TPA: prolyl oligopeptidase family serine peptidase [Phycisphaerales bacterium]|nr:prolyl oligopeptidase family serine peptidase [Phycisphaerales bacterium]